jgi:hypothetical protein
MQLSRVVFHRLMLSELMLLGLNDVDVSQQNGGLLNRREVKEF